MTDVNSTYAITLNLNVLNHLGLNLYSNVPSVLSEVVANSGRCGAQRDGDQDERGERGGPCRWRPAQPGECLVEAQGDEQGQRGVEVDVGPPTPERRHPHARQDGAGRQRGEQQDRQQGASDRHDDRGQEERGCAQRHGETGEAVEDLAGRRSQVAGSPGRAGAESLEHTDRS
ncbi:MAG: hypothetical protein M3507_06365 [Actinomycetota bacterium]|nr:hypothetical protein [Actinomycetota bacterium]